MKYCPNCGTKLHSDVAGCPECGGRWAADGDFVPPAAPAVEPGAQPPWEKASSPTYPYCGFKPRVAARLIDELVCLAIAVVMGFVAAIIIAIVARATGRAARPLLDAWAGRTWPFVVFLAVTIVASLAYHVLSDAVHGSTLGKMALGMTVLGDSGDFCSWGAALKRELAYIMDAMFFGLVAYEVMKDEPRGQRVGDFWAHTVVVRRESLQPAQRRSTSRFAAAAAAACLVFVAVAAAPRVLAVATNTGSAAADQVASAAAQTSAWTTIDGDGVSVSLPDSFFGGDPSVEGQAITAKIRSLGPTYAPMVSWVNQMTTGPSHVLLISIDAKSGEFATLAVLTGSVPEGTRIGTYTRQAAEGYSRNYQVTDWRVVSLGDRRAGRLTIDRSNEKAADAVYVFVKGRTVYLLVYTTTAQGLNASLPVFDKSAGSFATIR